MPQLFYSPLSINAAQVPSTQTDFPVLVSQTDTRFKTTGNGGHVNNSSGFDIRPYSDIALSSALTYELERYNASTGEVVMWVKVASLSSSTTPIYLGYGDTTLTTDGSSTATWSNNFVDVYHFKDGTTLSVADSSPTPNNGSNFGATAAAGQIDGGLGVASASNQYVAMGSLANPTAQTFSVWVNGTTFPNDYNGVVTQGSASTDSNAIFVKSNGKIYCIFTAASTISFDGTGSHTLSAGTWYYLAATYDSSAGMVFYVNAASDQTVAANGTIALQNVAFDVGRQRSTQTRYFNGVIDEVRIASIARSQDWITTEYNNQFAPGTFETLGAEVNLSPFVGLYRL